MAKLSSVQKNLNRQKLIEKFSNKRKVLKKKIMDKTISIEERLKLQNCSNFRKKKKTGRLQYLTYKPTHSTALVNAAMRNIKLEPTV